MSHAERILALNPGFEMRPMRPRILAGQIILEQGSLPHADKNIEDIQSDLIDGTGLVLPDSLIEGFGYGEMFWQMILKQNAMSAIYIGSTKRPDTFTPFQDAEGIIAINAAESKIADKDSSVVAKSGINLSGSMLDSSSQTRAVELCYDSTNNSLFRAFASVSPEEFFPADHFDGIWHDIRDNYYQITKKIPTAEITKYYISGWISQQMKTHTSGHNVAIDIHSGFSRDPNQPLYLTRFIDYPNPGIKIKQNDENLTIDFDPRNRSDSRLFSFDSTIPYLPSWNLVLPKHLEG